MVIFNTVEYQDSGFVIVRHFDNAMQGLAYKFNALKTTKNNRKKLCCKNIQNFNKTGFSHKVNIAFFSCYTYSERPVLQLKIQLQQNKYHHIAWRERYSLLL
jgi:hypothetical protein